MKYFIFAAAALILGSSGAEAARMPIANHMSCEQAVGYYRVNKRIYVIAHGKNIVPIYGHKPASEWRSVRCPGRAKVRASIKVKTLDSNACVIAYACV